MARNDTPGENGHGDKSPLGSAGDDRLIAALLAGDTQEQAARKARCSPRTVRRRLADPDFSARLAAGREQLFRSAVDLLVVGTLAAGKRLVQLVADPDSELALKACGIVLAHTLKAREQGELAARLAELETRANAFAEQFPGRG
jgi:hypothetical protein